MARVKISREFALKAFVASLMETFVDAKTFTRANVEQIGKTNGLGQMMFASQSQGYGKMTRLGQGMYVIPENWLNGNSPWEGVTEIVPVAKETKPKAPKEKKSKKEDETVVEAAPPVEPEVSKPAKTKLTKQELLEKAKQEIAKKKVVSVSE